MIITIFFNEYKPKTASVGHFVTCAIASCIACSDWSIAAVHFRLRLTRQPISIAVTYHERQNMADDLLIHKQS